MIAISDPVKTTTSFWDENIRKASATKKKAFVENAVKGASQSYDEYVGKMVLKIGKPVVSATFTGDPWHGSTLTVVTNDGNKQVWDTKMILNYSKYGTMFNQFPSRLKK